MITLYKNDLPADLDLGPVVAVDSETMGLRLHRDALCVVQLSSGNGDVHIVQLDRGSYAAVNLKKLLSSPDILKIFHFARFDVAAFKHYLNVDTVNIYCTKIASKLCRTSTNLHGLKNLCRQLLDVQLSKDQQLSDWGVETLTSEQLSYAAEDVLYLHRLKAKLDPLLQREGRMELAQSCFQFLPSRAVLDLLQFDEPDIFAH